MSKVALTNAKSNFSHLTVDAHLLTALTSSPKDRLFILQTESRILSLLRRHRPSTESTLHFQDLNSYYRMLVHRVVRFYGLERTADSVGRSVTVYKPQSTYVRPLVKLFELLEPASAVPPEEGAGGSEESSAGASKAKFTIMKRNAGESGLVRATRAEKPSKTLEERERAYEEARARIFEAFVEAETGVEQQLVRAEEPVAAAATKDKEPDSRTEADPRTGSRAEPWTDSGPEPPAADPLLLLLQDSREDVVQFSGWKNIDAIPPFIPAALLAHPPGGDARSGPGEEGEHDPYDIDFESIWIPQHVFVAFNIPAATADASALRALKARCKRHHCKLLSTEDADTGLLLFTYRVGETEERIGGKLGLRVERWRPRYFPEPPQ